MADFSMPNLGSGAQQLRQYIEQIIDKKIAQYVRSNPLQIDPQGNITIPNGCSLTVTGGVVIDGSLESGNYQQGSAGYMLGPSQIATYTSIQGFAGGLAVSTSRTSFGLTKSMTALASTTFVVPNGFTQMVATMLGQVYASNPNTSGGSNGSGGDALYAQVSVSAGSGGSLQSATTQALPTGVSGSNGFATATTQGTAQFSQLTSGEVVTLTISGQTAFQSIASSANCFASANLTVFWLP